MSALPGGPGAARAGMTAVYAAEHGSARTPRGAFRLAAQAAGWDARYSERGGARWSGRPSGRLLAEVAGLAPGRALDVGCGEGRRGDLAGSQRLDGHRYRHLRSGSDPGAGGSRASRRYFNADDLALLLGGAFTTERHAAEPRIDPPPDNPHTDVVLRARRR